MSVLKKIIAINLIIALFVVFAANGYCDDTKDFHKKMSQLSKKMRILRKNYIALDEKFTKLKTQDDAIAPTDRKKGPLAKKINELKPKKTEVNEKIGKAMVNIQKTIISFMRSNSKESVEAVFKEFYSKNKYPDLTVDRTLLVALRRNSNKEAIKFMVETLKTSKNKILRKMLCDTFNIKNLPPIIINALIDTLNDKDNAIVLAAANALTLSRNKTAVSAMISALERISQSKDKNAITGLIHSIQKATGEYMLESAVEFRSWWTARGEKVFKDPSATSNPLKEIGKDGPKSTLYGVITSKRVIFVCDVSHSMSASGVVPQKADKKKSEEGKLGIGSQGVKPGFVGTRIDILKIELEHVINDLLAEDAKFNIITYSHNVKRLKKRITKMSKSTRKAAIKFVKNLKPMGSTNVYGALEMAFSDKDIDTIYFLSDGQATVGKAVYSSDLLAAVRRWNQERNITLHTIGLLVGTYMEGENKTNLKMFLQALAMENGGQCRIIEENNGNTDKKGNMPKMPHK